MKNCHQNTPRIAKAQPKRSFNSGGAVLAMAEKRVPVPQLRMRVRIVGIVRKRGLSL